MGLFEEHGDVRIKLVKPSELKSQASVVRLTGEAFASLGEPRRRVLEEPHEYKRRVDAYWAAFNAPDPQTS